MNTRKDGRTDGGTLQPHIAFFCINIRTNKKVPICTYEVICLHLYGMVGGVGVAVTCVLACTLRCLVTGLKYTVIKKRNVSVSGNTSSTKFMDRCAVCPIHHPFAYYTLNFVCHRCAGREKYAQACTLIAPSLLLLPPSFSHNASHSFSCIL